MLVENYGERGCSQCGRPYQSLYERHAWYENHRADITADLRKIGLPATVRKWSIDDSVLLNIRHQWGLPVRRYHWVKHRKGVTGDYRRSH